MKINVGWNIQKITDALNAVRLASVPYKYNKNCAKLPLK